MPYVHIAIYKRIHIYIYMYIYICIYIRIYTNTNTYTYIHIHIHTYTSTHADVVMSYFQWHLDCPAAMHGGVCPTLLEVNPACLTIHKFVIAGIF